MDWMAGWPEWLVWCAAGAGAVLAMGVVACIIEAAMDVDNA